MPSLASSPDSLGESLSFFRCSVESDASNSDRQGSRSQGPIHGGDLQRVDFSEVERFGFQDPDDLLDFHAALTRLAKVEPQWSTVAELRVFGGYSHRQIAKTQGCGESTVRRKWADARKWLASELADYAKNRTLGRHKMRSIKATI